MIRLLNIFLVFVLISPSAFAEPPPAVQTAAKQALIIDYDTGAVLLDKNADERMPTSSMSKVLTMYLVFEALQSGKLGLEDEVPVSEKAWRMGGSKMFVEVDKKVRVEDLIRGVIVQSGNDATIVLAEAISGSEERFARALNEKAAALGMKDSHFANASGWPDPDHYSTARDLAVLATAMIRDFPEYYKYYAETEFSFNNIKQANRNPLLYKNIGADGVKTGHTEAAGYGLIGSGVHDGRRVIMVLNGLDSERDRAEESGKLLEWALDRFENRQLFSAGDTVERAGVALGKSAHVPLVLTEDLMVTLPRSDVRDIKVTAHFKEPLMAPLPAGTEAGRLRIEIPNMQGLDVPLHTAQPVEAQGFLAKTLSKARIYLTGRAAEKS